MKPIIQWVPVSVIKGTVYSGYWSCRWRKGYAYKSGVGRTPREAYDDWTHQNGVRP